jgi:hypothetical protein
MRKGEDRVMTDEHHRIRFLVARDGAEAAREWVARTLDIYREVLRAESNYASLPEYRSQFEQAIGAFEDFLGGHEGKRTG